MKSAVVVFPGSNRERDMIAALAAITGQPPAVVWHTETDLPPADLIVLPGGFSYGDYLRSGAIAARSPVIRTVKERADAGVPVLGICNGFQILCEAGLLPGALMRNASLRFVCREVHLRVDTVRSVFTRNYAAGQTIRCPVAHGDGNYRCDAETLAALQGEDRIAFRYVDAKGAATDVANPNGSVDSIAGILNPERNVLGMMPHPENLIEAIQGGIDGRGLFESVMGQPAAA
ncbi:MAG: phosphoribosylformylglycinamidine synthase subunit PurQ [Bauldia litoralis]|uniref:phosphoribosylformylglycinamidine synthase subunit PurQ n=1 Tax=Bauldia litoralis TaxID=665467 RepID=UPI003297FA80